MTDIERVTPAIPPRYWWLKRIALAAGVFVLALVGICVWWGQVAESRLQAKIAAYHAAGEPILLDDYLAAPLPDEENAATFLDRAASLMTAPTDFDEVRRVVRGCQVSPEEAQRFLTQNQEALRLVHEASSQAKADWHLRLTTPLITTLLPFLSSQRSLAKTTYAAALYQHCTGHDSAAAETLRDGLGISEHLEGTLPMLITHLVGIAIRATGMTTLEALAPDLRIADDVSVEPGVAQPATRAQVQSLMRELLDDSALCASLLHALHGERTLELDTVHALCGGRLSLSNLSMSTPRNAVADRSIALVLGPAWKLDGVRMMDRYDAIAHAASQPSWPAAQRQYPPEPPTGSTPYQVSTWLGSTLMPSLERAILIHFRQRAQQRMGAIALAIRLYEHDHGRRPTALTDLVPDYLAAVPRDPFDPDDGSIRYLPDASPALLYSVGANGIDDGGLIVHKSLGAIDLDAGDQPFFLNGDRPLKPPDESSAQPTFATSTQAVKDDQEVENEQERQGQQDEEGRGEQPEEGHSQQPP